MIFGLAMILLPRKWAVVPMLIMACFISPAQRLVILSMDFNLLRLMVLFGWIRVMLRGELQGYVFRPIDLVLLLWSVCGTLAMTILYLDPQVLIYRLGLMYDALGMYFLFRCLIRDFSEIRNIAISMAWLSLPVCLFFLVEKNTGRNMFAIFGGVPEYTLIRNGSLRCQGAYAHPILAGAFWASSLPLIIATGFVSESRRLLAVLGTGAALLIVFCTTSSTPIMATFIALVAMAAYPFRGALPFVRWGCIVGLLLLHFVMNNPVWHLLARIDLAGGSTGWYRYKLIDDFINHFGEWWALGTTSTSTWWEWGSNDVTNQYVLEGVTGGLMTLILFVLVIVLAFRGIGRCSSRLQGGSSNRLFAWAVGASLFVHCGIFIGVSYFGQMSMLWFLTLAMAASLSTIFPVQRTIGVLHRSRAGVAKLVAT